MHNRSRVHLLKELDIPLTSRLALLSYDNSSFPKYFLQLKFLLSQIQLFGIVLQVSLLSLKHENYSFSWILKQVQTLFFLQKTADFDGFSDITFWLLHAIIIYFALLILLLVYISFTASRNIEPVSGSLKLWTFIRFTHPMIIFYGIHIFCLQVLDKISNGEISSVYGTKKKRQAEICAGVAIAFNLMFAFLMEFVLSINLSVKNTLGSKSRIPNIMDLLFKTCMPILILFIKLSKPWCFTLLIIALLYCLFRTAVYFYLLPYYKIFTLKIFNWVQALTTSLILASIVSKIILANRDIDQPVGLFLLIWSLSATFTIKLYQNLLQWLFFKILKDFTSRINIYHLLHYPKIFKYIQKIAKLNIGKDKVNKHFLDSIALIKGLEIPDLELFEDNGSLIWNKETKEKFSLALGELFLHQLKLAAAKSSNIPLLQATLAYHLIKQNSTSIIAHDIAAENIKTCSFINQNYFYLIQVLLLEKLRVQNEQNDTISLTNAKEILQNYTEYQNTKKSIRAQLDLQLEFWDNFTSSDDKVQLTILLNLCEKIQRQSKIAQYDVDQLLINTKTGFLKPYIISSFYYSFLQNDAVKAYFCYSNYISSLAQPYPQKKHLESGGLYFLISATDKRKGMILDYFGKLQEEIDIPKHRSLVGDSLSKIFPSMYASKFEDFFKAFLESQQDSSNNVLQLPVITNDNCLSPCSTTFNFIYQPTYGLCIYASVKPLVNNTRQVIVSGNGQILYCCKQFLKDMSIEDAAEIQDKQITEFCPDLFKILDRLADKDSIQKLRRGTLKRPIRFNHGNASIDQDFLAASLSKEYNLTFFNSSKIKSNNLCNSSTQKRFKQFSAQITGIPFSGISTFWFDISLKRISREGYSSSALITHSDSAMPPLPPEITKTTTLEAEDWYTTTRENVITLPIIRQDSPPNPREHLGTKNSLGVAIPNVRIHTQESSSPRYLNTAPLETVQSVRYLTSPTSERGDFLLQSEMRTETNGNLSPSHRGRLPEPSFFSSRTHPDYDGENHTMPELKLAKNLTQTERNLFYEALSWSMMNDNSEFTSNSHNGQKYTRHKQLRSILNSRKYSTMTVIYNFCFIFTFCFLFGNLAWLNVKVSRTSKEVNVLSQVIQDMYFRNYYIKITLREVHYWQAYVDQLENYELDLLTDAYLQSFQNLRTASKGLINSTSQLNKDLQTSFYEKRVSVFTQNGSEFLQDSPKLDTFQATSLLFSNMFQLADFIKVQDVSQVKFDQTALLIVDNSMNDLLLVSSDLTEKVRTKLFDAIEFAKKELQCIFIGYALDIILFIFLSFVLVMKRNKSSQKFVDIFTTLSPSQIGSIKNNLTRFRALLNEGSNSQPIDAYSKKTKSKKRLTASRAPQRTSHNNTNVSLRKLYQRNFLILFALILCLAMTLSFAIIYYHQALIKINGVEKQQINLISALKYLNTISVFNAGLQSMLLFNNITTIQGIPVTTALLQDSLTLLDVTDFQESLTNADGSLSKYQSDLLYNIDCEDLHSKFNPWSVESLHYACNLISDGTGQVSLMKTFLQLNSVVTELVQRFAKSDRSLASRKPIYSDFYNFYYCYGDVTNVMLFMSFEYSTNNFSEMVEELGKKSKTLAYFAFVVCGFLGVITWVFVIRKLSRMEFERKKMLALIPDKYLFANFLMKRDLGFAQ